MMAQGSALIAALGLFAVLAAPALADEPKLFYTTFNSGTIDAPIGTGGAHFGEPTEISNLGATIRLAHFATPCLELADMGAEPGWAKFEFIGGQQAHDGIVTFRAKLWFDEFENLGIYLRPADTLMGSFLNLRFHADGTVSYRDAAPGEAIGTYLTGTEQQVMVTYRIEDGTYDIHLGGTPVLVGRPCDTGDYGLGSIYFAMERDADEGGVVFVDDIDVTGDGVTPSEDASWSDVKHSFSR